MIDVIVSMRDAVFAALVAWTGVGDAEGAKAQKDQPVPAKTAIEKPAQQQQSQRVY